MDQLNDFRVSGWLENGLLKQVRQEIHTWHTAVGSLISASVVAAAASLASISVPATAASAPFEASATQSEGANAADPVLLRVQEIDRSLEMRLSHFLSEDASDVDAELLAKTRALLERSGGGGE